jgi:hypothetical protein
LHDLQRIKDNKDKGLPRRADMIAALSAINSPTINDVETVMTG